MTAKHPQRWIIISSCCAAPMNFSSAIMMEKTSAVTYQVVGHVKTILIFALGAVFFAAVVTFQNAIGFMVAMVGVFWYTNIQMSEKAQVRQCQKGKKEKCVVLTNPNRKRQSHLL